MKPRTIWLATFFCTLALACCLYGFIMMAVTVGAWHEPGNREGFPLPYEFWNGALDWYWPGALFMAVGAATCRTIWGDKRIWGN